MEGSQKPRIIVVCPHHQHHDDDSSLSARVVLEAARDGDVEALQLLPRDLVASAACASGCRALHWAAGSDQVPVMRFLLDDGSNDQGEAEKEEEEGGRSATAMTSSSSALFRADAAASGPSRGRTPLHYACRNGCLDAAQLLTERYGADPDAVAKGGVTPFQMAVWRNRIDVARYLVERHDVDPTQVNDFQCNAAHWACTCPTERAGNDGELLIPLLEWIRDTCGTGLFRDRQRQGHTAFHKACWLGHLEVVRWLNAHCDAWDDHPDLAGNYGVDLCRMAGTDRHKRLEMYLRARCSRQPVDWCQTLGLDYEVLWTDRDDNQIHLNKEIRKVLRSAYLERVRHVHPDAKRGTGMASPADNDDFHRVHDAYRNLLEGGLGTQGNPNHRLPLLLRDGPEPADSFGAVSEKVCEPVSLTSNTTALDSVDLPGRSSSMSADKSSFKARLLVVLREYGDKGMNVSNLKKKWHQVWNEPFPDMKHSGVTLSRYVAVQAGDVVSIHKNSKTGQVHVRARMQLYQPPGDVVSRSHQ